MTAILGNWQQIVRPAGFLISAIAVALIVHYLLFRIFRRVGEGVAVVPEGALNKRLGGPVRWAMAVIAVRFVLPFLELPEEFGDTATHIISLVLIGLISWLLIRTTYLLEDCVLSRFRVDERDNLQARKIHTQLRVVKRIVVVVVVILAAGTMLMTFPRVRQLGTTILASAGIIGIVVGMAAQRTIGTFIAGLQIALTQPIRVDDVVIVENEWGRIEEITLTYVVVKIWDLRRLIVPITYFIEKPFQNWTRTTADILGTVFIYVDYTVPIDVIREQLQKILNESKLWDKKVCVLQVTNTTERTVELRALMSAADASTAWSLRCEVREKLIDFVGKNYPQALPKLRAELDQPKKRE
jgi:small-conductance mechanosensitive channel